MSLLSEERGIKCVLVTTLAYTYTCIEYIVDIPVIQIGGKCLSTVNPPSDFLCHKASIFDLFFCFYPWQVTITLNKQRPTFSCNSKIWTSGKTQRKSTRISRARQIPTMYSLCLMPSQMSLSRTISRTAVCFNQVKTQGSVPEQGKYVMHIWYISAQCRQCKHCDISMLSVFIIAGRLELCK